MDVHGSLNLTLFVLIPVSWTLFKFKFCYINFEILIRLKMPNQVVTLLNRLVWSRLKHGYSESYRAIVLSLYFLNTLWSILKHGYLEMLLKAILNPYYSSLLSYWWFQGTPRVCQGIGRHGGQWWRPGGASGEGRRSVSIATRPQKVCRKCLLCLISVVLFLVSFLRRGGVKEYKLFAVLFLS